MVHRSAFRWLGLITARKQSDSLYGNPVEQIYANLSSETDATTALTLHENLRYLLSGGHSLKVHLILTYEMAQKMLAAPLNVNAPSELRRSSARRKRRLILLREFAEICGLIDFGTD